MNNQYSNPYGRQQQRQGRYEDQDQGRRARGGSEHWGSEPGRGGQYQDRQRRPIDSWDDERDYQFRESRGRDDRYGRSSGREGQGYGGYNRESDSSESWGEWLFGSDDDESNRGYDSDSFRGSQGYEGGPQSTTSGRWRQSEPGTYGSQGSRGGRSSDHWSGGPGFGSEFPQQQYGSQGHGFGQEQQYQQPSGGFRGKGPKGYTRSDDRIKEDLSEKFYDDDFLDASNIEIEVQGGEVTLNGEVSDKFSKRRAEDIAESCNGVSHVQNNIRLESGESSEEPSSERTFGNGEAETESGYGGTLSKKKASSS